MVREAAAQHYLTDAFAAGHLRTPVTAIRHFWHHRYPRFWQRLQHKVAAHTASALREFVPPARLVPRRFLDEHTLAAVQARTRNYPLITFGDLLARVFHDWDNTHGLTLQGGGTLFGDGLLDEGTGKDLAIAAARSEIDDVEVAYRLGASGKPLCGEALYRAVRSATAAPHDAFRPETRSPPPHPITPHKTGGQGMLRNCGALPSSELLGPPSVQQSKRPCAYEQKSPADWTASDQASSTSPASSAGPPCNDGQSTKPARPTTTAFSTTSPTTPKRPCSPSPMVVEVHALPPRDGEEIGQLHAVARLGCTGATGYWCRFNSGAQPLTALPSSGIAQLVSCMDFAS